MPFLIFVLSEFGLTYIIRVSNNFFFVKPVPNLQLVFHGNMVQIFFMNGNLYLLTLELKMLSIFSLQLKSNDINNEDTILKGKLSFNQIKNIKRKVIKTTFCFQLFPGKRTQRCSTCCAVYQEVWGKSSGKSNKD